MTTNFKAFAAFLSSRTESVDDIAAWLVEREVEREMMGMDESDGARQDNDRLSAACGPYDADIAPAQIRILSKQYTAEPDIVPYVAVLERWEEGMWLIAPFSPYRTPATPGEMSTGIDAHGLQVIQSWNGRTVQDSILAKSFLAGDLSPQVCADALALFRHEFAGTELPKTFSAKRGSPIEIKSDPRREYQLESIERLRLLSVAVHELAEQGCERGGLGTKVPALTLERLRELWARNKNFEDTALAAASENDYPRVPLLMCEEAWDSLKECHEVSGFSGFYAGDDPCSVVFYLDEELPESWRDENEFAVDAYKRGEGRELVGRGTMTRTEDGRMRIVIRLGEDIVPVDITNAGELVLVVTRK